MGNKHGTYDSLISETKDLLMQRTGKKIFLNNTHLLTKKYYNKI